MTVRIKRVYDSPSQTDGLRILVDRLWPRGLTKDDAAIDLWTKELAPSDELRRWFGHDERRFDMFARRYRRQLDEATDEVAKLIRFAEGRPVTLVYGAKDTTHNNAIVLRSWLGQHGFP